MATSTDLRAAIEEVQQQLPAEQLDALGLESEYSADWVSRIEKRVGALPWWAISAVVHAVIFLLATLLTVALPPAQVDEVVISTDVAKQEEKKYDENKQRDIFKQQADIQHETKVDKPMVIHEEAPIEDQFQTDNDMDNNTARGHEDAISDIPLGGTGVVGSMGVGGGGMAGCFGYRDGGGRKRAVARFGGSPATESAVEAALRWLARHQEADGHWDGHKYEANGKGADAGITALALLAFLGAGHTEKQGRFRDNVTRATKWIIGQQRAADGAVGYRYNEASHGGFSYVHAICGLALAEAYGMANNPEVGKAAQRAVDYSVNVMQKPYAGWRYKPKANGDVSVTGWYVMQLKSAKIAGLKVDGAAFQGAMNFVNKCTDKRGRVGYTNNRGVPSTTGVGMVCRQFMGIRNTDETLIKGAKYLAEEENLPAWDENNGRCVWGPCTFYHWYYGTLAMFQMGGEYWPKWNEKLKKTLVPNQCKGGPLDGSVNDKDGSWDPIARQTLYGGRVYSTALGALSLEVYYRYLPMYTK
ncbi:MAG: prenyltransferase/squalene oxidase repeat-containing protein [Planctomycetota bacterium]|jgi:hypothetical protein